VLLLRIQLFITEKDSLPSLDFCNIGKRDEVACTFGKKRNADSFYNNGFVLCHWIDLIFVIRLFVKRIALLHNKVLP